MHSRLTHGLAVPKNRDHRARERSVASLRAYILNNLANEMRDDYDTNVVPDLASEGRQLPTDGVGVHKLLRDRDLFRLYSSLRCSAQELVWNTVIDSINASADALDERYAALSGDRSAVKGTLELDESIAAPRYYDAVDVHLMPGNYDGQGSDAGVLPGAVYDNGFNVFAFGAMGAEHNDIGWSMANFVRHRFADLDPDVIVDTGCTIGHNTLPWKQTFPDAEVFGLDLAAPCLRYAHARAQSLGVPVHFRQRSSDDLGFEDASVDVVFSSMFLHELPKKHIERFFSEAYRVLKPGGVLINMELPPNSALTPYDAFYLDWDSYYNNEPFYKNFRDQDYREFCTRAGFDEDQFFESVMPRYTYVDEKDFIRAISGEAQFDEDTGRLSDDIQWYGFGARKT